MIIVCRKIVMTMEQAQCDQVKMELSNKPWLDYTSNHYRIVTTMLIHIWNEHPDMQASKLKRDVSFACLTLNQCKASICVLFTTLLVYQILSLPQPFLAIMEGR